MARLASLALYPEVRHTHPLPSERVRSLLDLEVVPRDRDERRWAARFGDLIGRMSQANMPWGTSNHGELLKLGIEVAPSQTTLADVANVPHKSLDPHNCDRFDFSCWVPP